MGAPGDLRRNADFVKLWGATSVSHFGTMFGALGLTALVYLDASPAQMGILAAASGAPVLVFSLFAGVWVDRLERRRLMLIGDFGRAALLLTVPAAAAVGLLGIQQLYVVAFSVGLLGLFFDLSYRAVLPAVVERDQLVEANSRLQMSESVSESVSPAVGGGIVQALGGPAAVLVDAITFALSGALVASTRGRERVEGHAGARSLFAEAAQGMRAVWRSPFLRAMAGTEATLGFFGGFFWALYGLWVVRELAFPPLVYGVLVGAGGVGSFAGAVFVGGLSRRFGLGPTMVAARLLAGLTALLVPMAGGPAWLSFSFLLAHQTIGDGLWVMHDINAVSLRQASTPPRLLGRVNATFHVAGGGLRPAGALVAGFLAALAGVRATLFVAAAGMAGAVLWLVFSPIPATRAQPGVLDASPAAE